MTLLQDELHVICMC